MFRESRQKTIRWTALIIGFILVVLAVVWGVTHYLDYNARIAKADADIAEFNKELLLKSSQLESAQGELASQEANTHALNGIGQTVSLWQTQYISTMCDNSLSENERSDKVMAIRDELANYFDEEEIYPWFIGETEDAGTLVWNCSTKYNFYGDTFRMLWECTQPGSTDIVALASAQYDVMSGRLSGLTVYKTSNSEAYMLEEGEGT